MRGEVTRIIELQEYIKKGDFKPELKESYFLNLIEAVRELVESIRKNRRFANDGLKVSIEEELYDIFYYVAPLAHVY